MQDEAVRHHFEEDLNREHRCEEDVKVVQNLVGVQGDNAWVHIYEEDEAQAGTNTEQNKAMGKKMKEEVKLWV